MAEIRYVEQKLSRRATSDGKNEVLLRFCVSKSVRPQIRTGVLIPDSLFEQSRISDGYAVGEIRIPRGNSTLSAMARSARERIDDIVRKVTLICRYAEDSQISREYIADTLHAIERYGVKDINAKTIAEARKMVGGRVNVRYDDSETEKLFMTYLDIEKKNCSRDFRKSHLVLLRDILRYEAYRSMKEPCRYRFNLYKVDKDGITSLFRYLEDEYMICSANPKMFNTLLTIAPKTIGKTCRTPVIERRGTNTIVKLKKKLSTFFNWMVREGMRKDNPFSELKIGTEQFGKPYILNEPIGELKRMYEMEMPTKHLEEQRDVFLFQCMIGCRAGDLLSLTKDNVSSEFIEYVPGKTPNVTCRVAMPKIARNIVNKYRDSDTDMLLPFISLQKYNDAIKDVFRTCGLIYTKSVRNGKTGETELKRISDIASSHLARRLAEYIWRYSSTNPSIPYWVLGHALPGDAHNRYVGETDNEIKSAVRNIDRQFGMLDETEDLNSLSREELLEKLTEMLKNR